MIRDEVLDFTGELSLHSATTLCQLVLNVVDIVVAGKVKEERLTTKVMTVGRLAARGSGEVKFPLTSCDWCIGSGRCFAYKNTQNQKSIKTLTAVSISATQKSCYKSTIILLIIQTLGILTH